MSETTRRPDPDAVTHIPEMTDAWVVETLARRLRHRILYIPETNRVYRWGFGEEDGSQ
jgi:hypothetical protein